MSACPCQLACKACGACCQSAHNPWCSFALGRRDTPPAPLAAPPTNTLALDELTDARIRKIVREELYAHNKDSSSIPVKQYVALRQLVRQEMRALLGRLIRAEDCPGDDTQ